MDIFYLIIGIVIGAVAAWMVAKNKYQTNTESKDPEIAGLKDKLEMISADKVDLNKQLDKERETVLNLTRQLSIKETEQLNLIEKLKSQKEEVQNLQEKFAFEFKNLANEIFEEKSKKFTDQNKVNLSDILKPLGEKITEFEKKVEQTNKESIERNSALKEQILGLKELNIQITKEAENLTKALKGDTKSQGNWGEFILESILEKSGLEKGREYFVQESKTDESGRRFQPDVVVKLPDNKNIIVDSKVTLTGYERFVNEDEEALKDGHLKSHLLAIRSHIKNLSVKNYQQLYGVNSLDFVLMFIPIEPAFILGVQADNNIFSEAYDKNIVIVSPSTLIATLRTIANIWKNEYQNRNSIEIAQQSGALYDKFVAFTEDLIKVGRNLDATQKEYTEAMKKLSEGKGNLVKRAEKIKQLGANAGKSLDSRLIDRSED